jgi:hypothetical protein
MQYEGYESEGSFWLARAAAAWRAAGRAADAPPGAWRSVGDDGGLAPVGLLGGGLWGGGGGGGGGEAPDDAQ